MKKSAQSKQSPNSPNLVTLVWSLEINFDVTSDTEGDLEIHLFGLLRGFLRQHLALPSRNFGPRGIHCGHLFDGSRKLL
jgi:hypothetical protein